MNNTYGRVNLSIAFNPTSAFPVDVRAHFDNSDEMISTVNKDNGPQEVGSFDSTYYFGQLITLSFDNHTKSNAYLVIKNPEKRNLLKLTNEDETNEIRDEVIKIGKSIDFEGVSTGLFINELGKLAVKLANNNGLHITEEGLAVKTDSTTNNGNVMLKNGPDGIYGEFSWSEFN